MTSKCALGQVEDLSGPQLALLQKKEAELEIF